MSERKDRKAAVVALLRSVAALAVLSTVQGVSARNILRPMGVPLPATAAAAANQAAAAQSAAALQQRNDALRQAFDAIRNFQAAQDAARTAALAGVSSVPNGIGMGGLDPQAGGTWLNALQPSYVHAGGRTEVTVTQTGSRAICTWNTFNIGRETDLTFDQSAGGSDAASWAVLNRVLDPSGQPSQILGTIKAQGQVFVINRNGIIFGGSSQVNVGSFLTSGLEIAGADEATANGHFLNDHLASLDFVRPAWGPPVQGDQPFAIEVDAGAQISAADGGRVVLLGGSVLNAGTLASPDGQVFLAAGKQIQLVEPTASQLTTTRGFAPPEESVNPYTAFQSPLVEVDGAVENTGIVSARRGSILMLAGDTRQDGLATATTGAQANGSIYIGQIGLRTTLGPGSVTQVLPDLEETTTLLGAGASFRSSSVTVAGDRIDVLDGATLYAPSGDVKLRGYMTGPKPDSADPTVLDDTRIYVAPGARIDVSGLEDVQVAVEQNSIRAELRANELRDNPLLQVGPLRSRTVYFDARLGASLEDGSGFADLSGYYDLVAHKVSEFMTAGGQVSVGANQFVLRAGAVIDISGGSIQYQGGLVRKTVLITDTGIRVPIENAVKGVRYVGADDDFVATHARWGVTQTFSTPLGRAGGTYQEGYQQGSSAGTLTIAGGSTAWGDAIDPNTPPVALNASATAAVRILDGSLIATTVTGPFQQVANTGTTDPALAWRERPAGGTLSLTQAGDVTIANGGSLWPADGAIDASQYFVHMLPARWFSSGGTAAGGIGTLSITSGYDSDGSSANRAPGGHLLVDSGVTVDLGDYGSFTFTGKSAIVDGSILAPGGTVSVSARDKSGLDTSGTAVKLGSTGSIDVAGRFTNDALDEVARPLRPLNGGTISIASPTIELDAGSRLDVTGGGILDASGTKLTSGNGGAISLDATVIPRPFVALPSSPLEGTLELAGTLDGHALGKGGSLTLRTNGLVLVDEGAAAPAGGLALAPEFFSSGGFSSYAITGATGVHLTGALRPTVESYVPQLMAELPTGTRLADVLGRQRMKDPEGRGSPMSVTFSTGGSPYSALTPDVTLAAGSSIRLDPGSNVTLSSTNLVRVDGTIDAPGGTVSLYSGGVVVSSGAEIHVPGYVKLTYDSSGNPVRTVMAAGSVFVAGDATGTIGSHVLLSGLIDASGISGTSDLPTMSSPSTEPDQGQGGRHVPVAVRGDGGTISIVAQGGIVAGDLRVGVDPTAPADASGGQGGSLLITSTAAPIVVGAATPASDPGAVLHLTERSLDDASADFMTISAPTALSDVSRANPYVTSFIAFEGNVDLQAGRSLTLVSPMLGSAPGSPGAVTLRAPYISFVGAVSKAAVTPAPSVVGATLDVRADLIDVERTVVLGSVGGVAVSGFASAYLDAGQGDIRLSNHRLDGSDSGFESLFPGLAAAGDLTLAAGQVYVVSRGHSPITAQLERDASDPGFTVSSPTQVSFTRPQDAESPPPTPLSFGERLTVIAPVISQGGVLRAPGGQIQLMGSQSVSLLPGSITSVALVNADGTPVLVPFGTTLADGTFVGYDVAGQSPHPTIQATAPSIDVAGGAVVDVTGGGDVLGFHFVPGNGGSADPLAYYLRNGNPMAAASLGNNQAAPFAVLPSLGSNPAPIGPVDSLRDPRLKVGDQVHLQGVPGLPDGVYTLLPAHYALLPGGRLVLPLGGSYASPPSTYDRPDGAVVVAGYTMANGQRTQAGYGRYAVMSNGVFSAYGQLETSSLNAYAEQLSAAAGMSVRTLNDGGAVSLSATTLALDGTGRFGAGPGGSLGTLDVASSRIAVAGAETAGQYQGYLVLDPDKLTAFGAGSVLLGGTRAPSASAGAPGTTVSITATDVVVDDAGHTWSGSEILLAATSEVTVANGSSLSTEGSAAVDSSALLLSGSGALLRLSSGDRVVISRTGVGAGALTIGDATLSASGSVSFDTGSALTLGSGLSLSAPRVDLASAIVQLGDVPPGSTGTILGKSLIEKLAKSADLLIRGYSEIQLYGDLTLGDSGSMLPSLTLDTPLLQGVGGASASFSGGQLVLQNTGSSPPVGIPAGGAGSLTLDVDRLVLGPGSVQLAGFDELAGRAGRIVAQGDGGLTLGGNMGSATVSFAAGRLEVASGVSYRLAAAGGLFLGHDAAGDTLAAATSLGGRLELSGSTVLLDTAVTLPAGSFVATASGGPLTVGANARVDVSGRAVDFQDVTRFAPAGEIRLASESGDLTVASGASLDVSGSSRGGDAGRLELTATQGQVSLDGGLHGTAVDGGRGAIFALDVGTLPTFSALNQQLEAGGFTEAREIRVRGAGQDLSLGDGERISAHDVLLEADQGSISVAGTVGLVGDASHAAGGRITFIGGAGVSLAGTATVNAQAAGSEGDGYTPASGRVLLATTGGTVSVTGGTIDVSGGRDGGVIVVRAPRTSNGAAVGALTGTFLASGGEMVQGLAVYDTSTVDAAWLSARQAEAATWLSKAQASLPVGFVYAPAIVARSGGALSVQGQLNLAQSGTAGAAPGGPGYLGLVAGGDLTVAASLSDGFDGAAPGATLLSGRSYGIGLEAGGNILLEPGTLIRTGTGDVSIRAGGDLTFSSPTTQLPMAVVYTAGQKTEWAAGFQNAGAPGGSAIGEFPTQGGFIDVQVGGNIVSPIANQTTSAWLFRSGSTNWNGTVDASTVGEQTSWSVVYANFQQGLAALGGGDIRVRADGNIDWLQAAIPTTGQVTTPIGATPAAGDLVLRGGGDLVLSAGADIRGGLFVLGRGMGDLRAAGNVTADTDRPAFVRNNWTVQPSLTQPLGTTRALAVLLGIGDGSIRVTAGGSATIEGAFDPMQQGEIDQDQVGHGTAFVGYTERAVLDVTALGGPVAYLSDPWASVDLSQSGTTPAGYRVAMAGATGLNQLFGLAPPSLNLVSLSADANLVSSLTSPYGLELQSAPRGNLQILAEQNVILTLNMQEDDRAPEYMQDWRAPFVTHSAPTGVTSTDMGLAFGPLASPTHLGDEDPARIYAILGSVCAQNASGTCFREPAPQANQFPGVITITLPKPLHLFAGQDVVGGHYVLQGNDASDLSFIQAGRDIYQPVFEFLGQGTAVLTAGRDVLLQQGVGADYNPTDPSDRGYPPLSGGALISYGNSRAGVVDDTLPPNSGVNLYVLAGMKNELVDYDGAKHQRVDYDAFTSAYLDPSDTAQRAIHDYFPALRSFMAGLEPSSSTLSEVDLVAAFRQLPEERREVFLTGILFTELRDTGIDYNTVSGPRYHSYQRGFDALHTLFAVDPSRLSANDRGSIFLDGKRVETLASAGITLLAPYGQIEVGTDQTQKAVDYSKGGVVTRRGGDIRMMADGNIDLFTSRVFTLEGGDITMWTSAGSITAGSGSKTTVFQRPLEYTITPDGTIEVDAFGLQTGAGIGVLDALGNASDRPPSRLDLIAPHGEVNAGDAGIRAVGNLNIAAAVVVGIENIQATGATTGVPKVEAPSLSTLTTASQVSQAAAKEGVGPPPDAAKKTLEELPSLITVEVVGYETTDQGTGDEKPEDAKKKKKGGR